MIGSGSLDGASGPSAPSAPSPGQARSGLPARNSRKRRRLSVLIFESGTFTSLKALFTSGVLHFMNQSIRAPEALTTGAHLAISLFPNSVNCAGVFGARRAPEALATGAPVAISLFTNSGNCAGVFGEKRAPSFGSRAWISGEAMIRMASEFHRWTMSAGRSEEHTSELQSHSFISYPV